MWTHLEQFNVVRRYRAESYLLQLLVAFGVTVILTRSFLKLTGYPQIGNDVLHIAHALWGGGFLLLAVLLPLVLANGWVYQLSALLSGIGTGLFFDEVGKFITQANDYFFPPALPLIYGLFLLGCLGYLFFRQPRELDSRTAFYHVLEGLTEVADGELNEVKMTRLEEQLAIAGNSERQEIQLLAQMLAMPSDKLSCR